MSKILATLTILLFALAITGYAYTHWQEIIQIQSTAQIAKLEIIIQDYQTTLDPQLSQDNHTLSLRGALNLNQPILTNITIKNTGTTPATITHLITTNNTSLWDAYFTYNQNLTSGSELSAQNIVVTQQNITLTGDPPTFAIEVRVTYTATFASWTDTITITYILTYQEEGGQ